MDILGKLFDSLARVKMMRLFILNPTTPFSKKDIMLRSQVTPHAVAKETNLLVRSQLIVRKTFTRSSTRKRGDKSVVVKTRLHGWEFNPHFPYARLLKELLVEGAEFTPDVIARKFRTIGRVRLLLISGIFINSDLSRVDILIVGEHLKKNVITSVLKSIESEVGRELKYAVFDTDDFKYRISIYDKFVRDVLDSKHIKVVDKLGIK